MFQNDLLQGGNLSFGIYVFYLLFGLNNFYEVIMDTENLEPTVEYTDEETGELVIKELAKEFLSKGAWSTMMFLYQEKNAKTGDFGDPKVSIRRYQKQQGVFKQRSKFNISSKEQAKAIIEILKNRNQLPRPAVCHYRRLRSAG